MACVALRSESSWVQTTCAFVPDIPKALVPEVLSRAGEACIDEQICDDMTSQLPAEMSSLGLTVRRCRFGECRQQLRLETLITIPTRPAAPSECAMWDFAAPSRRQSDLHDCKFSTACLMAQTSIGSPSAVPVPCVSTLSRFLWASRSTARISCFCACSSTHYQEQ